MILLESNPTLIGNTEEARARLREQMLKTAPRDVLGRPQIGSNAPGYLKGRVPASKGRRYEPEPLTSEEIARLFEAISAPRKGERQIDVLSRQRLRALVVCLWRTGLRISEALALTEHDLNPHDGTVLVRHGKGDKRRIVKTDAWAWAELDTWVQIRRTLPVGALFCVLSGPTAGRPVHASQIRTQLKDAAGRAGIRKRCNPHMFRHSHAADLWREKIDMLAIQRQLGHVRLDVTQLYLRSLCVEEVLAPIGERAAPTIAIAHQGFGR